MRVLKCYLIVFFLMLIVVPYVLCVIFSRLPDPETEKTEEFSQILVYRCESDTVESVDCFEYICNVVAGEMKANSNPEAIKAQAVACYTYLLSRINYVKENPDENIGHNGAYVCDDSGHCMAYLEKKQAKEKWGNTYFEKNYKNITAAVKEVLGMTMVYNDAPINAVFHSISCGSTQSAQEVWGASVPYLVSVESAYDKYADGYKSEKVFDKNEFKNIFSEELGVTLPDSTELWIGETVKTESGMVKQITILDTIYSGTHIRKLLDLRSACFDVTAKDDKIIFTVYGYGHGVGLSQNGANQLAAEGYTYTEILNHYYKDIQIKFQKP